MNNYVSQANQVKLHSSLPLVSIVIVNWNGSYFIEKCLNSLLEMQYDNFEIIVVDNNSSDRSVEKVKKLFPGVKIIANEKNLGFARACNLGFKVSKGSFIGLFNNDAVAEKKWLLELVSAMSRSDDSGAAGGPIYYLEPSNRIWFNGGKVDGATGFSWHIDQNSFKLSPTKEFDTLSGCAILIKREIFEKIGGLDEGYFLYADDVDLSINIRRMNLNLLFVPSAVSWHAVSACKKLVPLFTYKMKTKCDQRLILKNYPLKFIPSALLFRSIILPLSETLYFYKNPRFLTLSMAAFLGNMKDLKDTFKHRQRVEQIGKAKIQNRFRETIRITVQRLREMKLYW